MKYTMFIVFTAALSVELKADLSYKIVDTGQNSFWDSSGIEIEGAPDSSSAYYGQDAQFQGNQPSYTVSNDGLTVMDNVTGLTWQQTGSEAKLTYYEALTYVDQINAQQFGGFSDWRLPTIKQLYSLIDFRGTDPSSDNTEGLIPFIDSSVFSFRYGDASNGDRVIDSQWASSTLYVSDSEKMFGVNFADGRIKGYGLSGMNGGGKTFEVRLVRGNQNYGTNQFSDNGNQTISDLATGLMWSQMDNGEGIDWATALAYVKQMNEQNYLGYSDWRLPNAKELQSILDYHRSPDSTGSAAIDPIFQCSEIRNLADQKDFPYYWTGTTHIRTSGSGGTTYNDGELQPMSLELDGAGVAGESFLPGEKPTPNSTPGSGAGNQAQGQGQGRPESPQPQSGQQPSGPPQSGQQGSQQQQQQGRPQSGQGQPQPGDPGAAGSGGGFNKGAAAVYIAFGRGLGEMNSMIIDIHGAGCQRSDPKSGNIENYPISGHGPQGDVQRVFNYVRLVRDN